MTDTTALGDYLSICAEILTTRTEKKINFFIANSCQVQLAFFFHVYTYTCIHSIQHNSRYF